MKKTLYFFVCLLVFNMATAQQEINTSFKTQMNTTFGNLDKNRVPHGILLDYGMEFTNVPRYNGTLTDSTYTDMTAMSQIYKTLLTSRIRDVSTGFVTPTDYDNRWKNNRSTNFVAIGGLYFKYSQVADNAVATNKITVKSGKAYDKFIGGVWQNPYQEFQTFAMTPAIKKYDGLNMQVRIPSNLFYSNYQSLVQSIQIDFGNGAGYVTVPFNQNFAVNYTAEGVKVWKYKLNLTNGTSLHNQSRIKVVQGLNTIPYSSATAMAMPASTSTTTVATLYSHTITGTKQYTGATATVKLTIDLGAGHSQITKPLIVAEGFDLGVVFNPENANGMYTYKDFQLSAFNSQSSDLRNLITGNSLFLYGDQQYDIIYVDWNNGIDYMQRNAFALEEVIKWVNTVKVGTAKNVVLGQSMGGVIARYALADMEQTGLDHKTRLFVSHDAPQQGANIPVSIQFMYRHLTNQYIQTNTTLFGGIVTVPILENNFGISNYLSILDAPASRQLLANFSNLNYGIDNSIHNSFYNELKAKGVVNSGGYPLNCRNIAISNGAECGIGQGFNPNDDIVNYNWNKGLSFGGDLLSMVYLPLGGAVGGLFLDNDFFGVGLAGLIPGKSKFGVEFNAKAMPYGSGNQIYKGKISYTKKILWIGPNITVNITNVQKNQPSGILPLDTYGGGFYNTSIITGSLTVPNLYVRDKFNFIPTTSALDIGKKSVVLNDNDYKKAYIGATPPAAPKNPPFVNFSTDFDKSNPNSSNKMHISFNIRNGEWLAKELLGGTNIITTNCSYMCAYTQITGSNTLCTSATYTAPSGGIFNNWTITQGASLVTLTGNGTPNVTLTALPNASRQITLSLSMGDNNAKCGNITLTKTIWVGTPKYFSAVKNSTTCNTAAGYHYLVIDIVNTNPSIPFLSGTTFDIIPLHTNLGITKSMLTPTRFLIGLPLTNYQTFVFHTVATNSCGSNTTYGNAIYVGNCSYAKQGNQPTKVQDKTYYTIYPKPSNDIVTIDLRNQENQPEKGSTISGELFDLMGQPKSKVEINHNKATFSVRELNKGIYVLKIYINDQVESHQIAVE